MNPTPKEEELPLLLEFCSLQELANEILKRQNARGLPLVTVIGMPPEHEAEGDTLFLLCGDYPKIAHLTLAVIDVIAKREPRFKFELLAKLLGDTRT